MLLVSTTLQTCLCLSNGPTPAIYTRNLDKACGNGHDKIAVVIVMVKLVVTVLVQIVVMTVNVVVVSDNNQYD